MPGKPQTLNTARDFKKTDRYRHAGLIEAILWGVLGISLLGTGILIFRSSGSVSRIVLICFILLAFAFAALLYLVRKAFREECQKRRRYLDITGVIVLALDAQQRVTLINRKGCEILGLTEREIIGKNWFDHFIPFRIRAGIRKVFDDLMAGRVAGGEYVENPLVDASGEEHMVAWQNTILRDRKGRISGILSSGEDISQRSNNGNPGRPGTQQNQADDQESRRLKQAIEQAHKMESIGRLAGGIAHDFNNMLSVIIGYSELALASLDPNDRLYGSVHEIYKAGRRSADLTTQLLGFARKQAIAPRVLDLNDVVSNVLKMLRRLIGEDISLVWLPASAIDKIFMDPTQIDQILANLCANARYAIRSTGRVIIETDNVRLDEAYCRIHSYAKPGDYVRLTFSDDGDGMDEETMAHIFEPFFTTKDEGEGTGLGLATVYGIVKQNDGVINVYSEPGQGTSFRIYFPKYRGEGKMETSEIDKDVPRGHGECVLLVEDEPAILEMARTMLEGLGYNVLVAGSPNEALELTNEGRIRVDVLMTDMVMPEMNGRELSEQLQEVYPQMKVVFMSGYSSSLIAHGGVLEEGVHFLAKPFSLKAVAEKLEEVLREEKG